jgi:small subunit ribosomal protein S3
MGRKVNPIGFRLKINKTWEGRWYAEGDEYVQNLHQDFHLRELVRAEAPKAGVSRVDIERFPGKVKVIVHTAKPGILIGRKGENVKKIRQSLEAVVGKKIDLEIKEIKSPDLDAYLVAQNIAEQLERRISYQRAMKRSLQQASRQGGEGIPYRQEQGNGGKGSAQGVTGGARCTIVHDGSLPPWGLDAATVRLSHGACQSARTVIRGGPGWTIARTILDLGNRQLCSASANGRLTGRFA